MSLTLAQQLGYTEQDRLLIINGDDFGLSASFNAGIQELLEAGAISSATVMMPCAFARAAAAWSAKHLQYDVGVHFTFTSEWEAYKWAPVTRNADVSSLVTSEGYFHSDCLGFEQSAAPSQVALELYHQIEMALHLGMKPTHADSHMGSLYGLATGKHFLLEALDVCAHYGLPFRLPRFVNEAQQEVVPAQLAPQLAALAQLADQKGVVIVDYLIGLPFESRGNETTDSFLQELMDYLKKLKPGVSELIVHPSKPAAELQSFHGQASKRVIEWEALSKPDVKQFLQEQNIKLIHWRELQQLQRNQSRRSYPF
ncbi:MULTISPECIES: polysaccharide deacetylase family protein [Paenibacillus]|uniref:polysaccharide deacetylase family protein n=1 Tax=Paenibacillus TaxID=44249 RepID=UPI0020421095|nr:polysaccharide deacetylase family protein [Paenibacillus camelliae]MCM3631762.1 polysaccharide deacetylase family protein [Paenibacillus camelliae]